MNAKLIAALLGFVMLFTVSARAGSRKAITSNRDLGPLGKLVGMWLASGDMNRDGKPEPFIITYKLTCGGTALIETIMPGTGREMVTVYTREGSGFQLTHYCTLGNQPRMLARNTDGKKLEFEFLDATGMNAADDAHMHSHTIEIIDPDHVLETWNFWEKSRLKSEEVFKLTREK